jgi:hypothetical protein
MDQSSDELWLSFEAVAKQYPHDGGVRITADLTRWLLAERQRIQAPISPVLQRVIQAVGARPGD